MNSSGTPPDPRRWPLQIRRVDDAYLVTLFDAHGHVRHFVSVDTEIRAYRAAHRTAHIYHHHGPVLVVTAAGASEHDLEQLMKNLHPQK